MRSFQKYKFKFSAERNFQMDLNDEMVEMMKFYEFYKKIKASEEKDKLTNKNN